MTYVRDEDTCCRYAVCQLTESLDKRFYFRFLSRYIDEVSGVGSCFSKKVFFVDYLNYRFIF